MQENYAVLKSVFILAFHFEFSFNVLVHLEEQITLYHQTTTLRVFNLRLSGDQREDTAKILELVTMVEMLQMFHSLSGVIK